MIVNQGGGQAAGGIRLPTCCRAYMCPCVIFHLGDIYVYTQNIIFRAGLVSGDQ